VAIGQRKASRAVIKHSRSPGSNRMTCRTLCRPNRESGRDVVRYAPTKRLRAQEGGLVAAITVRRAKRVIVVHMARRAGRRRWGHVRSGQRKPRCAVVKACRGPTDRCMAYRTVRRGELRPCGGVHGIIRLLPNRQMAA